MSWLWAFRPGVTLMIAGNIPGRTQTLPLAIYDAVQTRQYDEANMMVLVLSALALVYIWGLIQLSQPIRFINRKQKTHGPTESSRWFTAGLVDPQGVKSRGR
jgi:ABC-type Fe3+ transport system permease subunit